MMRWQSMVLSFALTGFASIVAADDTPEPGSRALFDGHDLRGWVHVGPGGFKLRHGQLHTYGDMGMLWYSAESISHSIVRVVYRVTGKNSDSGVFIRIPSAPVEVWMPINRGYEVEIGEWPDEYGRTGVIYSFSKALAHASKPVGIWNTMDITIDGPHTVVVLNGVTVTDYTEGQAVPARTGIAGEPAAGPRADGGYIGLQNHPGATVVFKEVSVRPIDSPRP